MSRIRSIHPGQWTDEAFVSCSMAARLLALAIRNEADDNGVFEWKPVQIKMRLFPVDGVDVPALLAELAANDLVQRFEEAGKSYGAIRNFRRFQNPRRPNPVHVLPPRLASYVGLPCPGSAASEAEQGGSGAPPFPTNAGSGDDEGDPFPTNAGKPPQREQEWEQEGNGRGMGAGAGGVPQPPADADPLDALCRRIEAMAGADRHKQSRWMTAAGIVAGWLARGADPELDIVPAVAAVMAKRKPGPPPGSPEYFRGAVMEALDARRAGSGPPAAPARETGAVVIGAFQSGSAYTDAWKAWREGGKVGPEPKRSDYEQRGAA